MPSKSEDEYRAEDDHRTLTRAAEIQGDVKRMAGVRAHHVKQQSALKRMDRLMSGKPAGVRRGRRTSPRGR